MGQCLSRFTKPHVVGKNARKLLFTQELQPGQAFSLIRAKLQTKPLWRVDMGDSLRATQLVSHRKNVTLALKLPACRIAEISQTRRVETRQAQRIAAIEAVEEIDQRGGEWLDPPGRHAQPLAGWRMQFNRFVIGNKSQLQSIQPARIATEKAGQQGGQRQTFAFDNDAHVEVKPATIRFNQIGFPAFYFKNVMAVIVRKFNLPARITQSLQAILHEISPITFMRQAVNTLGCMPEGVQGVPWHPLQTAFGKRFEGAGLGFRAALQTNGFTLRQGNEFMLVFRANVGVGIAKKDTRHIKWPAVVAVWVIAPGAVAMGMYRVELKNGLQGSVDQTQALTGILGGRWQIGRQFGQGFGHQGGFLGREGRQAEQTTNHRRITGNIKRPGFTLGQIQVPGRVDRNNHLRWRIGAQRWALEAAWVNLPADTGRA